MHGINVYHRREKLNINIVILTKRIFSQNTTDSIYTFQHPLLALIFYL